MKKLLKIILIILGVFLIVFIGAITYFSILSSTYKLDVNKLVNLKRTVTYYYSNGEIIAEECNGVSVTDISCIPEHTKNAFIAIEDKRFYQHNGIDFKRMIKASFNNIKSFSFKEGASTISQQLIKNTHLSNEKTIKRKIAEIKLARQLEKSFNKDEILEKYLNTIYFGDNCYGITCASIYYFNKNVEDLDINESAILAGVIKAPTYYSPKNANNKCLERKNIVLKNMYEQGYITSDEYESNISRGVNIYTENLSNAINKPYFNIAKKQFNKVIDIAPYSVYDYKVNTTINQKIQQYLVDEINQAPENCEKGAILIDKQGKIIAYYSTCGEEKRQIGSTIKPLLVYAPAIENDIVCSITKISDEKLDFNGYSPSNYNDKYYGEITVSEALSYSSNTCAVKLLNYVGVDKAIKYLNKTAIKLSENDNSLCLALGATENGSTLNDIASSYSVFLNSGNYINSYIIADITHKDQIIYKNNQESSKVFSDDTIDIMNDMLRKAVTDGTAKKLSFLDGVYYAKTGTVGNENGNSDAYTISYTNDYILGCWFGSKNDELLDNTISGGASPCVLSSQIWGKIYNDKNKPNEIEKSNLTQLINIDKISYEKDGDIVLADNIAPNRYVLTYLSKTSQLPKIQSTRFSHPKIEEPKISVNQNDIRIELCLTQSIYATIFKYNDNEKTEVFDTKINNSKIYIDNNAFENKEYVYGVVPYFISNDKRKYFGEEIIIKTKKSSCKDHDDDWWCDYLN